MNLKRITAVTAVLLSFCIISACGNDADVRTEATSTPGVAPESPAPKESKAPETKEATALAALDADAFDELVTLSGKIQASQDEATVTEGSRSIRLNDAGLADKNGRYTVVESTLVPVTCYSDGEKKVSFKVTIEDRILVDLAPVEKCDFEFDESLQLEIVTDDGVTPEVVLPKRFDVNLEPLFMSFSNSISKFGF